MNSNHRFGIAVLVVVAAGVASLLAAPSLPDELVVNWDSAGEPSGTMPATQAIALVPGLMAGLLVLFAVIPRIDPLSENIAAFRPEYDWFVVVMTAFLFGIHAGVLLFNLGYEFPFIQALIPGFALVFYYAGIVLEKAERNWFVGIRTPWTLSSDQVWQQTHQLGAKLFKLTALCALVGLLFGEYAIYFLLVPALGTALVTVVYSYYCYERLEEQEE